jgi:hemoglobin
MTKELKHPNQLPFLITSFYDTIRKDPMLGPIFEKHIARWDEHTQLLCDFWESTLFARPKYKGNPLMAHVQLAQQLPLQQEMFERWLFLWENTLDQHFHGEKVAAAKARAQRMAQVISSYTNQMIP